MSATTPEPQEDKAPSCRALNVEALIMIGCALKPVSRIQRPISGVVLIADTKANRNE